MHNTNISIGARSPKAANAGRGRITALAGPSSSVITHSDECVFPYPIEAIFDLIADVESYPQFLPYWRRANVKRSNGDVYHTVQEIGLGPLSERFESQTRLERPSRIEITSSADMFHRLSIEWRFEAMPGDACRVRFSQECDARSPLARTVLDVMFYDVARSTLKAFEKRARELYGPVKSRKEIYE